MAKSFDETLQELVNTDYASLLSMARKSLSDSMADLVPLVGEEKARISLIGFIGVAVAADGRYTPLEKQMMGDLFGDYEVIGKLAAAVTPELYESTDSFVDRLPGNTKARLCLLATCILAVDEQIEGHEHAYLRKLMG